MLPTLADAQSLVRAFVVPNLRKLREEWGTHRVIATGETKAWATRRNER